MRPMGPMRRVLVVENDPAIRRMLLAMLELEGYDVNTAEGAAPGLDLLRTSAEPQVVLVNHLMPDLDGPAVLAVAATDTALARHHYVLMSSCPRSRPGPPTTLPYHLLVKPFTVDQLVHTVEDAAGASMVDGTDGRHANSSGAERAGADGTQALTRRPADGRVPLLLAFSPRSTISRRRGRIVVRTQPGAILTITVFDADGHELSISGLGGETMAGADGSCAWRWAERVRGGELTVEVRAVWGAQRVTLARMFAVPQT